MLSTYKAILFIYPLFCILLVLSLPLIVSDRGSMTRASSSGDKGQPFLVPLLTVNMDDVDLEYIH